MTSNTCAEIFKCNKLNVNTYENRFDGFMLYTQKRKVKYVQKVLNHLNKSPEFNLCLYKATVNFYFKCKSRLNKTKIKTISLKDKEISPNFYYLLEEIRVLSLLLDSHTKSEMAFVKAERNYFRRNFCLKGKSYCLKHNISFQRPQLSVY